MEEKKLNTEAEKAEEKKLKTEEKAEEKQDLKKKRKKDFGVTVGGWYVTLMVIKIPVAGLIYLLVMAVSDKSRVKRKFARAYLLYELSIALVCVILLFMVVQKALPYAEQLLDYIEML